MATPKFSNFKISDFKHPVEYKMTEPVAAALLKTRKKNEMKMPPKDYLRDYVNREYGLRGYCVNVVINNE